MRRVLFILTLTLAPQALAVDRSAIDRLPRAADTSKVYRQARKSLAFIESREDPSARNRRTSASGKYQFMKRWDPWFRRHAGRTWTGVVPGKKASRQVREAASREQDRLFDVYFNRLISPWLVDTRAGGLGRPFTDPELLALYHRQGERGAVLYLRSGADPWAGRYGNRHVSSHIEAMRKAMRFENYLDHQGGS